MSEKRTIVGKFVHSSWANLNIRCGKYQHLQTKKKCQTYQGIKILFNREEYKKWCWEHQELIESLDRPSLDRIEKTGHYSLGNIQIIELKKNIRKDKTVFTENGGTCFRCKLSLSLDQFCKDKRRQNGLANICKKCDSKRHKKRKGTK